MWRREDGGSVLLLVPAAVLVLVVLGAVAIDAAVTFMAQRELQNATAAAASDAVIAALEEQALYECGLLRAAADRAAAVAEAAFVARESDTVEVVEGPVVALSDTDPIEVSVSARGRVDLLFAPAVAGLDRREVTASTTARAEFDPDTPVLPAEEC